MISLNTLIDIAKQKETKRIAVVSAEEVSVLASVRKARDENIIVPILIGDATKIKQISQKINFDLSAIEILNEPVPEKAAFIAVKLIREGKADILMKGFIGTAAFLHAIVHKELGIRKNSVMSHIAICEGSFYHKILGITDVAMNIAPTFQEKIQIIQNAIDVFRALGIMLPKVAVITPVETVNEKIESTLHASMLTMMNKRNQLNNCIVDGPLALDNAISSDAAIHKNIVSEVAGDADILLVPELNSGNILYKSLTMIGKCSAAAIIVGANVPIVLASRSDTEENKFLSIALATVL